MRPWCTTRAARKRLFPPPTFARIFSGPTASATSVAKSKLVEDFDFRGNDVIPARIRGSNLGFILGGGRGFAFHNVTDKNLCLGLVQRRFYKVVGCRGKHASHENEQYFALVQKDM